ncbi:MAG: hypothetical protein BWX99_02158 [Deltaproteobacteria bacterium ADurb.Bin151]|jgi:hypothetical protein|nr:MAG: hypothetical protein BWX99_02158 [Deltaproteobacteria bacterium ADurb.Bin151]
MHKQSKDNIKAEEDKAFSRNREDDACLESLYEPLPAG